MGIVESMRLDGKKGFVTGGARGIGKCTAYAFAEAGADIAVVDLDLETAQETAQEIAKATGRKVIAIKCDVTDEADVQKMVDTVVKELGGLDFCHANAGICINAAAEPVMQNIRISHPEGAHDWAAMVYLSPYHISPQPLVGSVQKTAGIPAGLLLYALVIAFLASFLQSLYRSLPNLRR